jgi:ATP-dependent Clp protease ATP-binding subunit ClpC
MIDGTARRSQRGVVMTQFDKFTERAKDVLRRSEVEAHRYNHDYIGTEHLLLGLIRDREPVASRALIAMGVPLAKIQSALEFIIGRGEDTPKDKVGLTPRAKQVLELAIDESRRLEDDYVGTHHILLGLVREGDGIAGEVLQGLGVTLDKARDQVSRLLSERDGDGEAPKR